jgi:trigger factor
MLKYNLVEEKNWRRKLEITIPEEDVDKKFDEVWKVLKKEAKIPGFRPGKAPINIIKSRYGKLAEKEVLETMIPDAYSEAVKESGLFPISEPDFSRIEIAEGKAIEFSAAFDVKPEFEVGRYTGFTLKRQTEVVPDMDIEKAYQRILDQNSSLKPKEGAAEESNLVIVDMEKTADPENAIKDKELKDFSFELNRDATLPQFFEALLGTNPGDERNVDVTYPQDYYNKDMAGKSLSFKIKVKEIKEIIRPELNEAFFKQFGDSTGEEDLKQKLREELLRQRREEIQADIRDQVVKSVIAANEFELPESLLENYLDSVVEDFRQQYSEEKVDESILREQYRPMGIRFIRWNLLYHKIAEKEKIEVTKEDTDKWLQNFADKSNMTLEQAKQFLAARRKIQDIKETILEEKVLDFITKSSTIEDM